MIKTFLPVLDGSVWVTLAECPMVSRVLAASSDTGKKKIFFRAQIEEEWKKNQHNLQELHITFHVGRTQELNHALKCYEINTGN